MSGGTERTRPPRRLAKSPTAFRTISEVAEELDVPAHVLRFWETKFDAIQPMKRGGGRRYYRPEDIDLLRGIRALLYDHGYTIKGVQRLLREHGDRLPANLESLSPLAEVEPRGAAQGSLALSPDQLDELSDLLKDLRELRSLLDVQR